MNYLALGAEVLQRRMEQYAGVTVTYQRSGKFSFNIVAIPGRNPVDVYNNNGVVLRGQVQDFTVDIEAFQRHSQGDIQRPLRGDEIVMQVGQKRVVFIVTGEDFATSHYESADSYGVAWRIHTKSDRHL